MSITVRPGDTQEITALFDSGTGVILPVRITLFQIAPGVIGAGVYPDDDHGTVLRWDGGSGAEPSVIHWQAPHCEDDRCGHPCRHRRRLPFRLGGRP